MRLIDADYLMCDIGCFNAVKYGNETPEQQHNSYSTLMMYEIAEYINDAETVDAEPVRHARWLPTNDDNKKRCSGCDIIHLIAQYPHGQANYCPHCGAMMDGAENE